MATAASIVGPVAITGCGVVSTAGIGLDRLRALTDGTQQPHGGPVAGDDTPYPPVELRTVPEFSLAERLGQKGVRRLDRMTGFGLLASQEALASARHPLTAQQRTRIGVAAGTSTGSIRSFAEFTAEMLTPDQPSVITPSRFPNIVLNSCAGQIAIWQKLRGLNATLAGGHLSGVSAMRYGANAIRRGYVDAMLIGGIEELCPQLAWAWYRARLVPRDGSLGEGSAFLFAERSSSGRPVLAELLAAEVGYCGSQLSPGSLASCLARQIDRALARSGLSTDDVDVVSLGGDGWAGTARAGRKGVELALGRIPALTRVDDLLGDCYSASGALQAAGLLARWHSTRHPAERVALLTGISRDGNAGCAVLRRPPSAPGNP
jgi:3-oxoacyl-[acyl-carrier-protein] synthase II